MQRIKKPIKGKVRRKVQKVETMDNFKISIIHDLGPFVSPEEAKTAKVGISKKVKGAKFSTFVRNSRGIKFSVKSTYIKKLPSMIPSKTVAAYVKSRSPNARVTVQKL